MFVFQAPPRTGFEISWQILGIRFRVLPSFFYITALIIGLLAFMRGLRDPVILSIAVGLNLACLFVALLFVTFVQALVYRSYGLRSHIYVRELMGGVYPEAEPPTVIQRIAVQLANPAAAFMLHAIVFYSNQEFGWAAHSPLTRITYFILWALTAFWGIIGLLPVFPYSGGRVMLEILTLVSRRNGLALTLAISIIVAVAYITYTILVETEQLRKLELVGDYTLPANIILAVFFALSVMQNWNMLSMVRANRPRLRVTRDDDYEDDRPPWNR